MESRGTVLANTRRKINAAKSRLQKSWEDVFGSCDKDKSGSLDYREFEEGVRTILNLPANAVCHNDLLTIFNEIDVDGSGGVNIEELLGYLTKGYRTPEEIASRAQVRIQRVRRALKMAFQNLATNDAALKKLFYKVDMDGDSSLSLYEFKTFVRMELKLSFLGCQQLRCGRILQTSRRKQRQRCYSRRANSRRQDKQHVEDQTFFIHGRTTYTNEQQTFKQAVKEEDLQADSSGGKLPLGIYARSFKNALHCLSGQSRPRTHARDS